MCMDVGTVVTIEIKQKILTLQKAMQQVMPKTFRVNTFDCIYFIHNNMVKHT